VKNNVLMVDIAGIMSLSRELVPLLTPSCEKEDFNSYLHLQGITLSLRSFDHTPIRAILAI